MTEKELMEIKISAYQIIEKTVKPSGNSGRVYVPIDWVGKKVKIVLLEPLSSEDPHEGE
jgi:putative transposon-encoded protein